MKVAFVPFYCAQDKKRDLFRPSVDSGFRQHHAWAQMGRDTGWDVTLFTPEDGDVDWEDVTPKVSVQVMADLPFDNLQRRVHWDSQLIKHLATFDVVVTMHELLAIPLRCLSDKVIIVMECGFYADTGWAATKKLFPLAWEAADLIHCPTPTLAKHCAPCFACDGTGYTLLDKPCTVCREMGFTEKAVVWETNFSADVLTNRASFRDIDVAFPNRASATGYSNHEAFLTSMSGLRTFFPDPTSYLSNEPPSRAEYEDCLSRSKLVVGLIDNGFGGHSVREAAAMGCVPVVLDCPGYRDFLSDTWPYYCTLNNLREVIDKALAQGLTKPQWLWLGERVAKCSYEAQWPKVKEDIENAFRSRRP